MLLTAVGIDGEGVRHPLGVVEGATENAAAGQALLDNLIERGLDPKVCRLLIVDGAKALREVIRRTFGKCTPIQRCQIRKGRNIVERLPRHLHASVRRALQQAWGLDDAERAENLLRNCQRRSKNASARRSKDTSRMMATRRPVRGALSRPGHFSGGVSGEVMPRAARCRRLLCLSR